MGKMGILKRAATYCFRQRVRTAILFLVLTLMAASMLISIAIRDAAGKQAENVTTAIGGKILLETDTEGNMGGSQQNEWGTAYYYTGDMITQEIVDAVQKVDGVVDYNSEETNAYYGAGVDFSYLPAALDLDYTPYGQASGYTVTLSSEKCRAFENGRYRLIEGRHITPDDTYACLISKELADYNKLSVGSKVTMYCLDSDSKATFEIVGIFDGTEGTSGNALTADEIPANCGYVDYAAVQDIFKGIFDDEGFSQLTIYVEDPVSIQNVYDRISTLPELKGKTLKLTIDTEETDAVSAPLESLQKLTDAAILIISVVSITILTLLLTIWVRGRKKETGILLSIGKSKANILLQFFVETFAVYMFSFAAAVPLVRFVAEKAGAFLASRAGTTDFTVQINVSCLFPVCLIGLFLIALSVAGASWTVLRSRPREVLTKMD